MSKKYLPLFIPVLLISNLVSCGNDNSSYADQALSLDDLKTSLVSSLGEKMLRGGKSMEEYDYSSNTKTNRTGYLYSRYTVREYEIDAINRSQASLDLTGYDTVIYYKTEDTDGSYSYSKISSYYSGSNIPSVNESSSLEEFLAQKAVPNTYYQSALDLYSEMSETISEGFLKPVNGYSYYFEKVYENDSWYYRFIKENYFTPSVCITYYFQYGEIEGSSYISNISYTKKIDYSSYSHYVKEAYTFFPTIS